MTAPLLVSSSDVVLEGNGRGPGLGRHVLLVDDDPMQLRLAKLQLENAGFIVQPACGPGAAEAILGAGGPLPDAIVSDVVMDDVDGFTLCRRLRANPKLASVPIVLLSATFDEEEDRALALQLGASALVVRSADQRACVDALVDSLERSRMRSTAPASMPETYDRRLVHQLARLADRRAASEARCELLFEHAHDAIALTTTDGRILDVNHQWTKILGVSREELRGRNISEFAAVDPEQANLTRYDHVVRGGANADRHQPIGVRGADGRTVLLDMTSTSLDIDGQTTIMSIGRNVTSLVEALTRLETSERHYRSLVENVPDVVWSATRDWKLTYVSPNIEKICGFAAREIVEGALDQALARIHVEDVELVQTACAAMAEQGTPIDIAFRWQHPDNRWLWIHLRAVASANGIDGLFSDITSRRNLEEQLFQAQKLDALGQLVAGVAHDFNNTLAVLAMNAAMLVDGIPESDSLSEVARDVVSAAQHGTELTKQLLAFSRPKPPTREPVYLDGLLEGISRMLARTVGSAIQVDIERNPTLGPIRADAGQIEQLVMNLVVNARDAMRREGHLRIATQKIALEAPRPVASGVVPPGRWVRLTIADDGAGMDEKTRQRIFEPFFTTKKSGGTGLGLSICQRIVRQADGFIDVESKLGEGTAFHVYFPG